MTEMDEPVVIIGAGPAGLTAAYHLARHGRTAIVFEADPETVGGICRTVEYRGFRFDIGGHRFYSKSREIEALWTEMLPREEDMLERTRRSRIFYRNHFFSYPLKPLEALFGLGVGESFLCLLSYLRARLFPVPNPANFEEWVSNQFGRRLFSIFFKTYTEKVWGIPCSEISADWAAQRIKGLNLSRAILSSFFPGRKSSDGEVVKTLIDRFRYPRLGPGMLWESCAEKVRKAGSSIHLGHRVTGLAFDAETGTWRVTAEDAGGHSRTVTTRQVISSAPIRSLVRMLSPAPAEEVLRSAGALRYRDFLTVAVIVHDRESFEDQWIYIHDPNIQAGRIQNFRSWSPEMVPDPGMTCYGLEYFCFEREKGLWAMSDTELEDLGRTELVRLGLASEEDIVDARVVRQKKAYPVYDGNYAEHVTVIRRELEQRYPGLYPVGRNGMHKYNNQDHSMMTALLSVENLLAGKDVYDIWKINEDAEYGESDSQDQSLSGLRRVPQRISHQPQNKLT